MFLDRRKKRYICTFAKKNAKGELTPNLVVIAASNDIMAKAMLCEKYQIPSVFIKPNNIGDYNEEGIKSIRLSETNVYEGGSPDENFRDDS